LQADWGQISVFLRNCWYVGAWADELAGADAKLTRRILNEPVLLWRTRQRELVAFLDQCPHRLVPLSAGTRVGDAIQCGYHGMTFGPDGRCVHIPGQEKIPDTARVTTYPVCERHGLIWIWMGQRDLVDEELIPNIPWALLENWSAAPGYTHVSADYRLLTDNLLDLSHENYIHGGTIANSAEETIAAYPVKVSVSDRQVLRAHREMSNILPPPMFAMMMGAAGRIDRWQTAIWTAPALNITDVGAYAVGGRREDAFVARILHMLTPETQASTHYFWAHCRKFRLEDSALTASITAAHHRTFDEDKEMLELQQRSLTETGASVPKVALRVDEAPLRARRLLSALIKKEEETPSRVMPKIENIFSEERALGGLN